MRKYWNMLLPLHVTLLKRFFIYSPYFMIFMSKYNNECIYILSVNDARKGWWYVIPVHLITMYLFCYLLVKTFTFFLLQRLGCQELLGGPWPPGEGGRLWSGTTHEGWHLHCSCWGKVSHQMDCPRGPGLQQILHQVRCLGYSSLLSFSVVTLYLL